MASPHTHPAAPFTQFHTQLLLPTHVSWSAHHPQSIWGGLTLQDLRPGVERLWVKLRTCYGLTSSFFLPLPTFSIGQVLLSVSQIHSLLGTIRHTTVLFSHHGGSTHGAMPALVCAQFMRATASETSVIPSPPLFWVQATLGASRASIWVRVAVPRRFVHDRMFPPSIRFWGSQRE